MCFYFLENCIFWHTESRPRVSSSCPLQKAPTNSTLTHTEDLKIPSNSFVQPDDRCRCVMLGIGAKRQKMENRCMNSLYEPSTPVEWSTPKSWSTLVHTSIVIHPNNNLVHTWMDRLPTFDSTVL